MDSDNDSPHKKTKKLDFLLLAFQMKIYIGAIITFISALFYIEKEPLRGLLVILIYSPYIVSLLLTYRRKKAFRIWYLSAAIVNIIYCLLSNLFPIVVSCIEILILVYIYTYKYRESPIYHFH